MVNLMNLLAGRIVWCSLFIVFMGLPPVVGAHTQQIEYQLRAAAEKGQIEELERLRKAGADFDNTYAFIAAIRAGQVNAVKYFVEHGADPNGGTRRGEPIGAAAIVGSRVLMEYLIEHGADINGESPADQSIISTPLLSAVYYGRLDAARLLIEFGADVNRVSQKGNAALHQAITFTNGNSIEFVRLFLESGANPDLKNGQRITPRQLAKSHPSGDISALIEQTKPGPLKPRAPTATYGYTLDLLNAQVVEQVMRFKPGSLKEVPPASGVFIGAKEFVKCRYSKEFRGRYSEFRLLIAICGNGPFDEANIDETVSANVTSLGTSPEQASSTKSGKELIEYLIRDRRISETKRNISYLIPLIGHGVSLIPTSIILESVSHTSFVVQIAIDEKEFDNLSRIEEVGLKLYQHATGSR